MTTKPHTEPKLEPCPFCGNGDYNLIFHHEEWRHYRKTDNHVQYCQAAMLRGKDGNKDAE